MLKKIALFLIIFYAVLGFLVLPFVLKSQIINTVSQETKAKISIDNIWFNPLNFRMEINDVKLSSFEDKELATLKSIVLNLEASSLFRAAIHVKNFLIEEPKISLLLDKNKQINFASIVKEKESVQKEETSSDVKIPRIIIDKIAIVDGSIHYEDYSNKSKFDFSLDSIGFELKDIDTKDIQTSDATLRLYTRLADGGFVDLKSELISLEPLIVKGRIDYKASKLYTQWRYFQDKLNLEVADGRISLHTEYSFNLNDLNATSLSNLNLHLDNLRVKPKGGTKDVLRLNSFYVDNASVKPFIQDVHVSKAGLESLYVKVKRDQVKNIDWLEYIKINSDAVSADEKVTQELKKDSQPWKVLVEEIALEKIKVDFIDKGIKPNVNTSLNELNLYAQNVSLDGLHPLDYQMNLTLNEKFKCTSQGSVSYEALDAQTSTKCTGLDVEHFVPYIDEIARAELKTYNVKLRSLTAGFDANVTVKDINSNMVVNVKNANINLDDFALNKTSTNRRLATFSSFNMNGISLNTATKEVVVADTILSSLNVRTARLKDSRLSIENLIVPRTKKIQKQSKKAKKTKEIKEEDYRVRLSKFALKGGQVSFEDKLLSPSVKSKIDRIYLTAKNIDSKKYSWMNYYLSARVNGSGKVKSSGSLRHTPLKQKGTFELSKVSLKGLTPYLQEHAFVTLKEGYVSGRTKTSYAVATNKPDLNVEGSFKVEDFFVDDSRDQTSLASFKELNLKEFTLEANPNKLFVKEIGIDSFYVNALIDANKTMNFATLSKNSTDVKTSEDTHENVEENTKNTEIFPVNIAQVNVKNGSAMFWDASLPINFKTKIHNLNGVIHSVSTNPNEKSDVDISGDVDEYGSTSLKGNVNSFNPKKLTDLTFNFRNLDLSAMTGYSATFAGHYIDQGKLFLNLNYKIKESELKGENSIIIKKIKLGEKVDIEGGSLPLGFVIALLEDSNGVIDIDMPVRGNVDAPDFKYGALVWKTFASLIFKAVASPFRFLGAMLGAGGDELEYAEFEGGSSELLPSEREKLDNVAKLIIKRPKISLSISGGYNEVVDMQGLQKSKLLEIVAQRSGAKNEEEKMSAMSIGLLEDIYEDARDDDKIDDIEDALEEKYKGDEFDREYLAALIKVCSDIQVVSKEEMQALAKKRTASIRSYLIDKKGVAVSRIKELEIIESRSDENKLVKSKLDVTVE